MLTDQSTNQPTNRPTDRSANRPAPAYRDTTQTRYMELCGMSGKTYREAEATLKNILNKHDTLEGNRLSLDGFLSYYREIAAGDPRQVFTFGFKEKQSDT